MLTFIATATATPPQTPERAVVLALFKLLVDDALGLCRADLQVKHRPDTCWRADAVAAAGQPYLRQLGDLVGLDVLVAHIARLTPCCSRTARQRRQERPQRARIDAAAPGNHLATAARRAGQSTLPSHTKAA